MSHLKNYLKNYLESTQSVYGLLSLSETPGGFFKHLVSLTQAIKKDPASRHKFKKIVNILNCENEEMKSMKKQVIDWMWQKLVLMKKLDFARIPEVKQKFDDLEKILSGDDYESRSGGYISVLSDYFLSACTSLARYGKCLECDDWLKISIRKCFLIFKDKDLDFPKSMRLDHIKNRLKEFGAQKKKIKPSSKEGKQLSNRLQHGFVSAVVSPDGLFFQDDGTIHIEFEWGKVEKIIYPKEYYRWWNITTYDSKMELDVDGVENLKWLMLLCRYIDLNPKPLSSLPKPKTALEADELCNTQVLQYFLSGFKASSWDGAPFSKVEILRIVDRFLHLLLLKSDFNYPGKVRTSLKDEADDYAYGVLFDHIDKMEGEKKRSFTNKDALKYVQSTDPPLHISEKSVKRVCKKIREEIAWTTKPGKKS